MTLTRITEGNIKPGSITANSLAEGISLGGGGGGGGGVTIDQIIIADENFANTENTQIPANDTNYIKLYGSGFEANANVFLTNANTNKIYEFSSNIISENEIQLTKTISNDKIVLKSEKYNLFLINQNGSYSLKYEALEFFNEESNYGWFAGGSLTSIVNRINFNSDTGAASVRGSLSSGRSYLAGAGNKNYGWFAGGTPGPVSRIDRITFAEDTSAASTRGPLSVARGNLAATNNLNYGWYAAGTTSLSSVERVTFNDDTIAASIRSSLSQIRWNLAGNVNNYEYGWFGGGTFTPSPTTNVHRSRVDRLDFANDITGISARANLLVARWNLAGTSNLNYGWFGGGQSGPAPATVPAYSNVERVDFSNDLIANTARGAITARTRLRATSNFNYGWFAGGVSSSRIERITFNDDTIAASIRGSLSAARTDMSASSGIL